MVKHIALFYNIYCQFYFKDNILQCDENVVFAWQVKSSLVVCEAIIRSALMRESRGAHYRSDFPELDKENWNVKHLLQESR